ncbi:MAG: glutathione S-transferase N-terminal domain-containing protein [Acidiferrobacter sp.]
MLDLYYWPTPNGHKITIFLEEAGLSYQIMPVDIGRGDQFKPEFLRISPNNRMPAIVDHDLGVPPLTIFESGAILQYLAEKTNRFCPAETRGRYETLQWLYWQVGGLGPMAGQNHHFNRYAPERIPYAIKRYVGETSRLYRVLDQRLSDREFINGIGYSIADMASYPWIVPYQDQQQRLGDFPNLARWFQAIAARPAVVRAYARAASISTRQGIDDEARRHLFDQTGDRHRAP